VSLMGLISTLCVWVLEVFLQINKLCMVHLGYWFSLS
jgi:hypothetical protein